MQGPPVLTVLVSTGEFAHVMGHAQRIEACRAQRHAQGVIHRHPLRAWQDVHRLQGVVSSFRMGQSTRAEGGASHIQPPALARHSQARRRTQLVCQAAVICERIGITCCELFWQAESTQACEKMVSKRSESHRKTVTETDGQDFDRWTIHSACWHVSLPGPQEQTLTCA